MVMQLRISSLHTLHRLSRRAGCGSIFRSSVLGALDAPGKVASLSTSLPLLADPSFGDVARLAVAVKGDRCEGVLLRVAGTWVGEWAGHCPLE